MPDKFQTHELTMPADAAGLRLDQALAALLPQYSRSRLQRWLADGAIKVDDGTARASSRVAGGEAVVVKAAPAINTRVAAEDIALDVVHADKSLIVINKPAGMVVHPGAGNREHTLQNALLAYDAKLARVPRAGLVHRLDKDTTGLLIVARTLAVHARLVAALQAREIGREYLALCAGRPTGGATIDKPIGRHRTHRTRMSVRSDGREAITHYTIEERFRGHTLLRVQLETGRTHQIRVHLAHAGLPVFGDPEYGGRARQLSGASVALRALMQGFRRQALHAQRLTLVHPATGKERSFEAPLPADFKALLTALRADARAASAARADKRR
jgi:23S rRNA pseudouridine1911/1915/1917 synthase